VEITAARAIAKFVIMNHVSFANRAFTCQLIFVLTVHFHALLVIIIIALVVFKDFTLMDVHVMSVQATVLIAHHLLFAHCVLMDSL
jgi:hypothetical protein